MKPGVKVFAPASVANVAVGYDILGFALEEPGDVVIARFKDEPGLTITAITGGKLPYAVEKNTAGFAAQRYLEHLGKTDVGIEMEIHKKMPFGSGLGSSAASAVAGVFAVNELFKSPLSKRELLPFAVAGEQIADGAWHADNVAPSLIGGIIVIRDNATLDVHRIPTPKGLFATVVYPEIEILTSASRSVLSDSVPLSKCIEQSGNLAGFIIGCMNTDFDLIARSLNDVIIEPQRAKLIPNFYEVKNAAIEAGALGCSISGAGPSIFALSNNSLNAQAAGEAMQQVFAKAKIESHIFVSKINPEGAFKY